MFCSRLCITLLESKVFFQYFDITTLPTSTYKYIIYIKYNVYILQMTMQLTLTLFLILILDCNDGIGNVLSKLSILHNRN